jgi:hypothetical protein
MMSPIAETRDTMNSVLTNPAKRANTTTDRWTGPDSRYSRLRVSSSPAIVAMPRQTPSAISIHGKMLA